MEEIALWETWVQVPVPTRVRQVVAVTLEPIPGTAKRKILAVKSLVGWGELSLLTVARAEADKGPATP